MSEIIAMVAGIGAAAVGGIYLAFSLLVMPALRRRSGADAAATMVMINKHAVRAPFMALFFGTAVACVAIAVVAIIKPGPDSTVRVAAAAAYLAGVVLTAVVNVPLNNRFATGQSSEWIRFARPWTTANHARVALSAVGAFGLLG